MTSYNLEAIQSGKSRLSQTFRASRLQVAEAEIEAIGTKRTGLENIVGVATEYKTSQGQPADQLCIKVYVVEKLDRELIEPEYFVSPDLTGGLPTDVEAIGEIVTQLDPLCYPVLEGGVSIGHLTAITGTLGCFVRKVGDRERVYVLSNNHVLANSNLGQKGNLIVQPGPHDGGSHDTGHPGDCSSTDKCIGTLVHWHKIDPQDDNEVDAAIAKVMWRRYVPRIKHLGNIQGVERAQRGAKVAKVGRTTGLTRGTIVADDADIRVTYKKGTRHQFTAWFVNQIAVRGEYGLFSREGDSGSAYLNENNKIVGLHFAGGNGISFGNHIEQVLQTLGVELVYQ